MQSTPNTPNAARGVTWSALLVMLILQGIGAIAGGAAFVAAPDGRIMGMPLTMLAGSPFTDYLIPGLFLLIILGIGPLAIVYGLVRRRRWAWPAAVLLGPTLLVWLIIQFTIVGFAWLQVIYAGVALVILLLALWPSTRHAAGW